MSQSSLHLKPVRDLLANPDGTPLNYFIPAYQRGYRWSPTQVKQLLDDIWEFIRTPHAGQFYCLQPLVVKTRPGDGSVEVVDGQQRLTTIHLILTYLKPMASMLAKTFFRLTFETRGDTSRPPLDPIDLSREQENIDYYHICQAYREIQKWCKEHPEDEQLVLMQHLLNSDKAGRNVKVIWFELGDHENVVEAFTRLNVGKIRLTNDELIRALFLGRGREAKASDDVPKTQLTLEVRASDEALKTRIAYEWDLIEKELQAADFWAFLTNRKLEHNRIGFLFELLADCIEPDEKDEEYKVFYSFSRKLAEPGVTRESEWLRIKQEFMRLQEWFEDERRIAFHIVGFLVTQKVELGDIRTMALNCTKSAFDRRLRDRVYQSVLGPKKVPPKDALLRDLAAHLDGLRHPKDRRAIRAILLLFNIATLLENSLSNARFQFDAYKDDDWDIEHVRSRATDNITDPSGWLKDCLSVLETQADAAALADDIRKHLAPTGTSNPAADFQPLRRAILKYFHEDSTEERNDLGNLTLLDSVTNRGYKNATFGVKRKKILELDKTGIFVPLCTRNVFLKAYSRDSGKPIFWTEADGDDYQATILKTLTAFFLGKEVAFNR